MTQFNGIKNEYFEWLYDYVCKGRAHNSVSYKKLFKLLHDIEFTFSIPNDVNRAKDGIDLRYRFALYMDDEHIADYIDGPCSVLEMILALAIRCECSIMDDPKYGDRTGQWFWGMIQSLGLNHMTDHMFDRKEAEEKIYIFLNRAYEPNGKGGLFYIRNCEDDLRDVEIWSQLCWYLDKFNY